MIVITAAALVELHCLLVDFEGVLCLLKGFSYCSTLEELHVKVLRKCEAYLVGNLLITFYRYHSWNLAFYEELSYFF